MHAELNPEHTVSTDTGMYAYLCRITKQQTAKPCNGGRHFHLQLRSRAPDAIGIGWIGESGSHSTYTHSTHTHSTWAYTHSSAFRWEEANFKVQSKMLQSIANLIPHLRGELHTNAKTLKRLHRDVQQESQRVTPASSVKLQDLLVSLNQVMIKIDSYTEACLDLATFGGDGDLSSSIKEGLEKGSSMELVEFLEVLQSYVQTVIERLDDILRGVSETQTLMSQTVAAGDAINGGQPTPVGCISTVGVGIAVVGAFCGCVVPEAFLVVPSTWLIAGSFMIGVLAVGADVFQSWHCDIDSGSGPKNTLHVLMESLKEELKCLRQEIDRCKRVGKDLQEKLANCIQSDGDFDSGASISVFNVAEACNELRLILEQD